MRVFDLGGREVLAWSGRGPRTHSLAALVEPGVYSLVVETSDYRVHSRLSILSGR